MRSAAAVLLVALFARPLMAADDTAGADEALSRRLTAMASDLQASEKKVIRELAGEAHSRNVSVEMLAGLESQLYEDVLTLLDGALAADPDNLHAHALSGEVLFAKAKDAEGTYDVCTVLDAEDEADRIIEDADIADPADLVFARDLRKKIKAIPRVLMSDDPATCSDQPDQGSQRASLR